jgi:hypothetical protein
VAVGVGVFVGVAVGVRVSVGVGVGGATVTVRNGDCSAEIAVALTIDCTQAVAATLRAGIPGGGCGAVCAIAIDDVMATAMIAATAARLLKINPPSEKQNAPVYRF